MRGNNMVEFPDMSGAFGFDPLLILVLVGFLLAFFGKNFFKAIWFITGGLIFMVVGLVIGYMIGAAMGNPFICAGIAGLIGFIIGGYMGISWARWLMCLAAAGIGFMIGFMVSGDILIGLVIAIIFFIIVYVKFDDVLSIMTAIMGGAIIGAVVYFFFWPNLIGFFAATIPIAALGLYSQMKIGERYPDHSYKDERGQ
jgi:hypothetical protein